MAFLTERTIESLLVLETRELRSSEGTIIWCAAFKTVWDAFEELARPPIGSCRAEMVDAAIAIHGSTGIPLDHCLEWVVTTAHNTLAPPWSRRLVHRPKSAHSSS